MIMTLSEPLDDMWTGLDRRVFLLWVQENRLKSRDELAIKGHITISDPISFRGPTIDGEEMER
jgi:hypothetical protein